MHAFLRLTLAGFLALLAVQAENWPQFRGPTGQGHSAERGFPLHWSPASNVLWRVETPGEGWSSPVIWRDRVFLTATTEKGESCRVLCYATKTGKLLWNREVYRQLPLRKEGKNSYATPTPVTDGRRVYAIFGDGGVAAVDFQGSVVWTNREVQFYSRHGLGASPILFEGLLIAAYDGSNRIGTPGQYPKVSDEERLGWQIPWDKAELVALDVRSGKRVWTGKRGMSRIAHVSPNLLREGNRTFLISPAGDAIQAFDPKTGERIWTVYSQGEGVTPSFAMGDGLIFTSSGFEKTTLRTVRTGGRGDVTGSHIAWEQRKGVPTQPSLLYVRPYLYAITDGGIVSCFQGATGEMLYQERVGGTHSASPVYSDGRIYFLSETGETVVLQAGPTFKILARNSIGERCQASMALSNRRLFIRSDKALICIGSK